MKRAAGILGVVPGLTAGLAVASPTRCKVGISTETLWALPMPLQHPTRSIGRGGHRCPDRSAGSIPDRLVHVPGSALQAHRPMRCDAVAGESIARPSNSPHF
jgi:hypothetical protein